MYIPKQFQQSNLSELFSVMNEYPLACVVYNDSNGIQANHFPVIHSETDSSYGVLSAHLPRNNPLSRIEDKGLDVLVIFQGPQCYISPSWYPSKKVSGKVVPTWNYLVVHARGIMRIIDDPRWVSAHLRVLTDHMEAKLKDLWSIADAPVDFTTTLVSHLVGVEIVINNLEGKWKVSQNRSAEDRRGVSDALRDFGDPNSLAMLHAMTEFEPES